MTHVEEKRVAPAKYAGSTRGRAHSWLNQLERISGSIDEWRTR